MSIGQEKFRGRAEHPGRPYEPPRLGGVKFGPALTGTLYALLLGSAALALWVRRTPHGAPQVVLEFAPWLFFLFLTGFGLYRAVMVRARQYPAAKAFLQIGSGVLLFMLLLPPTENTYREANDAIQALLADANPQARSVAAELTRFREGGVRYAPVLVKLLSDSNSEVRQQAHRSLVVLAGVDLGPPENEEARKRWAEKFP